ncbi:MAG: YggS family pyridoxal phosphate-dependent enzyme [Clostridiales Family XIII bacterium]|nr:YggS family pyridoxal phosphate-dependent enzyme [Clostridiales Family XIII bacterium]
MIEANIREIKRRIADAAAKSGRSGEDVLLVAVTKTRTPEEMIAAVEAGIYDLGENKVQELTEKHEAVETGLDKAIVKKCINWHMFGHLQRNKVKYIIGDVHLIHSVDSLRLATEIDARAASVHRISEILIQVNPAEEASKSGVTLKDAKPLIDAIASRLTNVKIKGLMSVAPAADDPEDVRKYFRLVKELFDGLAAEGPSERLEMKVLSMGMTHDFEVAIEEGSTLVRVGTGIFGERNYSGVIQ